MYAGNRIVSRYWSVRTVFAWQLGIIYQLKNGINFDFKEDDKKGIWFLEPVAGLEDTFYLKNKKYDEYMFSCEPMRRLFFSTNMRSVCTDTPKNGLDETYMWKFDRQNAKGVFNIWNVKYREPLFSITYMSTNDHGHHSELARGDVLTWHKSPDGMQFNWIVKCRNDAAVRK